MSQSIQKATLVPIYNTTWELSPNVRIELRQGVSFENVENVLRMDNFELWKEYVSEDARKKLANVTFALVHRFSSSAHVGPDEQKSVDLMYRVFIALRLVKPTRSPWSNIQYKQTSTGIDVFSFTHPSEQMAATPESESFNQIDVEDIGRLQRLLDAFLENVDSGPINIRRAIRHYELGYSEVRDPALQFVTWMMALEQFYSTNDTPLKRSELISRISTHVDLDKNIYAGTQFFKLFPATPIVTARATLQDLFVLRSRFVHGQWIKKEWQESARSGGLYESVTYADILREVASWLVRESLLGYFENIQKRG